MGPPYDSNRERQLRGVADIQDFIKDLERNLQTFYSDVLELLPISEYCHEVVSTRAKQPIASVTSVRLCTAAGVLQRWSLSALSASQISLMKVTLRSLQLYYADAVSVVS